MLCNNRSQGSLYLKDVGVDAQLLRYIYCTLLHGHITYTESSWVLIALILSTAGIWGELMCFPVHKTRKTSSVLLRDQWKRKKKKACQEGFAAHKIWVFFLTVLREPWKINPYIVVVYLIFLSEWIPLVLCPTFVSVPHGLGFSAVGCCGLRLPVTAQSPLQSVNYHRASL